MEITQKIQCHTQVRARLGENGELSVSVDGTVEYAKERNATKSIVIAEDKTAKVRAALADVLKEFAPKAAAAAAAAAAEAKDVASKRGEI